MNKWRQKHPDFGKANYGKTAKKDSTTYGELSDGSADAKAAEDIYTVAASHRATVIARDKAAAARRKKSRG